MKRSIKLLPLCVVMAFSQYALAEDTMPHVSDAEAELSAWDDEDEEGTSTNSWNTGAFVEASAGAFVDSANANNRDLSLAEVRASLFANRYFGSHFFSAKVDVVADDVSDDKVRAEVRELFADVKVSDDVSLRLGQQVLTWGTGDFVFINDLFSKDWQSMFAGRDEAYLKKPEPAVKLSWFNTVANLDVAWVPVVDGDEIISGERFAYYNPMLGSVSNTRVQIQKPKKKLDNGNVAMRVSKAVDGTEYALYGYSGFYSQPSAFDMSVGKNTYPRLNTLGASVRGTLAGGIANAELSYWDFVDEKDGSNPFIPNNQTSILLGYEHEIATNVTLSGQYLLQQTQDYDMAQARSPNPTQMTDEYHHTLTARLHFMAMQQKLTASAFAFYSPDSKDFYIRPKVSYRQNDNLFYETGANLFGGKHNYTQWGQFEDNSNIYARVKYNF